MNTPKLRTQSITHSGDSDEGNINTTIKAARRKGIIKNLGGVISTIEFNMPQHDQKAVNELKKATETSMITQMSKDTVNRQLLFLCFTPVFNSRSFPGVTDVSDYATFDSGIIVHVVDRLPINLQIHSAVLHGDQVKHMMFPILSLFPMSGLYRALFECVVLVGFRCTPSVGGSALFLAVVLLVDYSLFLDQSSVESIPVIDGLQELVRFLIDGCSPLCSAASNRAYSANCSSATNTVSCSYSVDAQSYPKSS